MASEGATGQDNGDDTSKNVAAFKVGELVSVAAKHRVGRADSSGGQAFVTAVKPPHPSSESPTKYDVKYVVGRLKSPEVKETRLQPTTLETTSRKRNSDDVDSPSLLSVHHEPAKRQEQTSKPAAKRSSKSMLSYTKKKPGVHHSSLKPTAHPDNKMSLPFRETTATWPAEFTLPNEEETAEVLQQWVEEVTGYSSQYGSGTGGWSASRVAGPPRVQAYEDNGLAWAPATIGSNREWLELRISRPCQVQRVCIYESLCGGAFRQLKLFDPQLDEYVVAVEQDPRCGQYPPARRVEDIRVPPERQIMTDRIRLEFDPRGGEEWYEVDAVRIIGAFNPSLYTVAPITQRQSILAQQISCLMNDESTADCTLVVQHDGANPQVRIPAHRGVLAARCPYFRAMLDNQELPLGGEKVIHGIDSAIFQKVIEWIYTLNVADLDRCDCVSLASASDYFQIDDLTEYCVAVFKSLLTVQNAALLYAHFEDISIGPLKEAALDYCGKCFLAVSKTTEFQRLAQPQLLAVIERYNHHVSSQQQQAANQVDGPSHDMDDDVNDVVDADEDAYH